VPGTLNIPLEGQITTRRDYARVVALYSSLAIGLVLAVVLWRVQFLGAPTMRFQPEGTVMSIHLLITPRNVRLITEHLGESQIVAGLPLTLGEILAESKNEITFNIGADGSVSYVVDGRISSEVSEALVGFGYFASIYKETTVVTRIGDEVVDTGNHITLRALSPFFQGEVVTYGEDTIRQPLRLNNKGIAIKGVREVVDEAMMPMISSDAKVLVNLTVPASSLAMPSILASLLPIPADSRALAMLLTNGGTILITEDAAGQGFYFSFDPGDMTVEEAASLGKDMMNRVSLSTLAWTIPDGTNYKELFSNPADITTEIKAEETFTFITLTNKEGDRLRMAITPNLITIANREISLDNEAEPESSCLRNAHTWFATTMIAGQTPTALLNNNRAAALFLENFSEVAINNNQTKLCW
jgi:hypothetical protein